MTHTWVEIPCRCAYKQNGTQEEKVLTVGICFDPPIEVVPHPTIPGCCKLTTSFGSKEVNLPYLELMKILRNGNHA